MLADDELAAFEAALEPGAIADKQAAARLGDLLRTEGRPPPLANEDFFNHQLMRQIETEKPRATAVPRRASRWLLPRLAWAGALALLIAAALFQVMIPKTSDTAPDSRIAAEVVTARPGGPGISATAFRSADNDADVIWLDGLDYIPASHTIR